MFQFQFEGRRKLMSQFEGNQVGEILSHLGRVRHFILFRTSTDWVRPAHINLIQKHPHRNTQNNV